MLKSPIIQLDEFAFFSDSISKLAQTRPQDISLILRDLNETQKTHLKGMLQTKRITVGSGVAAGNAEVPKEARIIMKAKRRTVPRQQ